MSSDHVSTLRASETALLRAVGRACPLPLVVVDADGLVRVWSGPAEALLGTPASETIGRPIASEAVAGVLRRVLDGAVVRDSELDWRRPDGGHLSLLLSAAPLEDESGAIEGAVACALPVVDRPHNVEDVLAASRITHEFNNVLTAISGYSAVLLTRIEDDHPLRPHAEQIAFAAERGVSLSGRLGALVRRATRRSAHLD